jgi:hypothetical protein
MIVPKKATTAVTRCNKSMECVIDAGVVFRLRCLPRRSRSSSSAPTCARSEELSRALSTPLSSNEGEQPVCRSSLIDNRKIEIFKTPALSGAFAYSHLSGALLVSLSGELLYDIEEGLFPTNREIDDGPCVLSTTSGHRKTGRLVRFVPKD